MNAIISSSLEQTFHELISKAINGKDVDLSPFAERYLLDTIANLAADAHQLAPKVLVVRDLMRKGFDADGFIRIGYLRMAGDTVLFASGIFPDALVASRNYFSFGDYLDMGQEAYANIKNEVFDELADKFPELVDVLNAVSLDIQMTSKDIKKYMLRRRSIDGRITWG